MRMPFESKREDARDVLARDQRPPILYLRSFAREARSGHRLRGMLEVFGRPVGGSLAWGPQAQDQLRGFLGWVGPYVCLARPDDPLDHLGAARLEVADRDWQQTVVQFLRRSSFVIVGAGATAGLRWELERLVELRDPRTVLLIAEGSRKGYQQQVETIGRQFPTGLPPKLPASRLVGFEEDWTPYPLAPGQTVVETLCPFFRRAGVNYPANVIQATVRQKKYGNVLEGPM